MSTTRHIGHGSEREPNDCCRKANAAMVYEGRCRRTHRDRSPEPVCPAQPARPTIEGSRGRPFRKFGDLSQPGTERGQGRAPRITLFNQRSAADADAVTKRTVAEQISDSRRDPFVRIRTKDVLAGLDVKSLNRDR